MSLLQSVEVPRRPVSMLEPVIGAPRYGQLALAANQLRPLLGGHTIWNVSSTAAGGGVAEMLQVLVGYVQDLDIPIGWLVITGDAEFFAITKRLHNQIHGDPGGGPLGAAEADHYARMVAANAVELVARVQPGDVVLLHDPQTAALAAPLAQAGARVVWRCHIGLDGENDVTRAAWEFLRPHLAAAEAYVFSRPEYVPPWIPAAKASIIPPSIDPFSPKNQELDAETVRAILAKLGVVDSTAPTVPPRFTRRDGNVGTVTRSAAITGEGRPGLDDRVLVQVSRWDRLKDMAGVMRGFADHVAPSGEGYLMLVGPSVEDVSDDPEGAAVYGECLLQWQDLSPAARARILLVTLPLDDIDENAAMVNALQRHATVVVQKSLAEGFGLTVSEGMWKGRPVIGSQVGGIIDQIGEGTGILLPDPADLAAFGEAARLLLRDQDQAAQMGRAAQAYVRERFLGDVHLLRYARLLGTLIDRGLAPSRRPAARATPGKTVTSRAQLAGPGDEGSGPAGLLVAADLRPERSPWPSSLLGDRWLQRHQPVRGEDRLASGHDGPVDRFVWVVAGFERLEHRRCPVCHALGCGQAGSPLNVVPPRGGRLRPRVDRPACGLGEQVRPGPRYDVDQLVSPAAGDQPASAGQVVGERVDRGVGGPLRVDAQLQVGQRVEPVRVGPVLADQHLRPELPQQRRDDRMEGAQPAGVAGPGGQRDIDR